MWGNVRQIRIYLISTFSTLTLNMMKCSMPTAPNLCCKIGDSSSILSFSSLSLHSVAIPVILTHSLDVGFFATICICSFALICLCAWFISLVDKNKSSPTSITAPKGLPAGYSPLIDKTKKEPHSFKKSYAILIQKTPLSNSNFLNSLAHQSFRGSEATVGISWYCVCIRTTSQEIATPFGLAMTLAVGVWLYQSDIFS